MGRRGACAGRFALVAAGLFALVAASAEASGLAQLKAFVDGAKSGRATFRQVALAKGARAPQESRGTFTFQRPGRFRWAYETPYEQLIVGDGAKLWIYDRDLNQVIVRRQEAALGASPAALLAGDDALDRAFDLAEGGRRGDLEWVEATPKNPESGVARVRIGLSDNLPRVMELADAFGNLTTLAFDAFERNVKLDSAQFAFVPPKGADVVGD